MHTFDSTLRNASVPREWGQVSAQWRACERAPLEKAITPQLPLLGMHVPSHEWTALLGMVESLHDTHPVAALELVSQLDSLVQRIGVAGLRRWVLTGLRLNEASGERSLIEFLLLRNQQAVESLHREGAGIALPDALPSLAWLWQLLTGQALAVQARAQAILHAAPLRPVLDVDNGFFLPDSYTALDADDASGMWNLWRAAVAHAVAHWMHSPRKQSGRGLKPMGHAVVGALEDARVEMLLAREFPGVRRWFQQAFAAQPVHARRNDFEGLLARLHWALADDAYEDDHGWIVKARTLYSELRAQGGLETPDALRAAASVLANDLGQMRLRMNLQTFHIPAAYRDDNSFLWDLGDNASDPPPELQSQMQMQRGASAASKPPPEDDASEQPVAIRQVIDPLPYPYPEWDYKSERVREDWCTVYERLPLRDERPSSSALNVRHVASAKWRSALRTDRHVRLRRQWQGDDLDLDAAVDWQLDMRAGRDPSPRIFRDAGRSAPPLSLLVLVDLSESCNDRVTEAGMSLLDLQKQALHLLARRLDESTTRLAIHGFYSDTRKSVSYFRLLDFGARFDDAGERMLDALRAGYSTRLGAALRHAAQFASAEHNARRAIVVLSDGVPSDIDVFDTHYLTADARYAVQGVRRSGVSVSALQIGEAGCAGARSIYGAGAYCMVRNAAELPARLHGFVKRLTQ